MRQIKSIFNVMSTALLVAAILLIWVKCPTCDEIYVKLFATMFATVSVASLREANNIKLEDYE